MRYGVDTNVLVRLLIADDATQAALARQRVEQAQQRGDELLVPTLVVQELVWVLRRSYKVPKADVLLALSGLLQTPPFLVQGEAAVREAMARWRNGTGDFADYLILTSANATILTFDEAILGEEGFARP